LGREKECNQFSTHIVINTTLPGGTVIIMECSVAVADPKQGALSPLQIPLMNIRAQYQSIKPEVMAVVGSVLGGIQLFLGPQLQAFEQKCAAFCECRYGIGLSNGTDALTLALCACGIGRGDKVITVSNAFIATVEASALAGATPVFVDIDPETYTLD
jgi:dTDP-4-amino-4,6-dideoxygalactose transaminase